MFKINPKLFKVFTIVGVHSPKVSRSNTKIGLVTKVFLLIIFKLGKRNNKKKTISFLFGQKMTQFVPKITLMVTP